MANPEHLVKLYEGAEAWNRWRRENPRTEVDLSGASLQGSRGAVLDLSGYDLSEGNLAGVQILWASLASADLRLAKMGRAQLERVDLRSANLSEASLIHVMGALSSHCFK